MRLEFPEKKHEKEYLNMIQEFIDKQENIIPGAAGLKIGEDYNDFLERTKNNVEGRNPKHPGHSTLYFIIDDNEKIVGATHIRHELSDELKFDGGNIGYGIRPSERRKGYATAGLKLALEKCKELGLEKVLLTCGKNNIGSAKAMINNGGIRDSEYHHDGHSKERYWIPVK